ncbi:DNA topoisomerase 4 subunit A [Labeo rohita]|uniref:DNA topoisomerase 4 subunit A n=1 Tax=Labeo rohita TaxID=84645 RepID=A0ABQ8L8W3_LABRO|nr:DNA topoisomerase 4 subunit A [Labeo rohita]
MIAELSKSAEFNAKEIKDCKSASSNLGKEVSKMAKENAELKEWVQEMERYKRRWNFKLRGLKEKTEERTRDKVLGIMAKINPQWSTKLENMVDSFIMWEICKDLSISFAEHILPVDREARALLWLQIKQAREAGHRAYFRGPHGYINGKRISILSCPV